MKSRTSYFNKTIFKKNILHFWPVWVVYTLFLTVMMPIRIFVTTTDTANIQSDTLADLNTQKIEQFVYALEDSCLAIWIFLMALVCAMALFYYMYSSKSCHMIHALPVNRTQLYVTNYVSGLLFMIVPQIFTFVVSAFVCALHDITNLEYLLYWLLMSIGMSIFAFSMAVAVGMITGQLIMLPVFFIIANFLYMGIRVIFGLLMMQLTYGLQESYNRLGRSSMLSPLYYLSRRVKFLLDYNEMDECMIQVTGGKAIAIYAVLGIVLAVVGLVIYRKRRLETVGDFITINWLKPVFRWGSTIVLSVAAAAFITNVVRDSLRSSSMLPILVGVVIVGVLIFFIAQMFVEKKFRVFSKRRGMECLCIQVLLVIGLMGIKMDMLGLESQMPKASEVKEAYLKLDYCLKMDSEKEIKEVMELHQQILDSKEEFQKAYYEEVENSRNIGIKYRLKDGTTVERHYDLPASKKYLEDQNSVIARVLKQENSYENYMASLFGRNYEGAKPLSVSVELYNREVQTYESVNMPSDLTEAFFEAVKKDIKEGNLRYSSDSEYEKASIYSNMEIEFYNADGIQDVNNEWFGMETSADWKSSNISFCFTEDCVHILEVLDQSGFVNEPYSFTSYQEWLEM